MKPLGWKCVQRFYFNMLNFRLKHSGIFAIFKLLLAFTIVIAVIFVVHKQDSALGFLGRGSSRKGDNKITVEKAGDTNALREMLNSYHKLQPLGEGKAEQIQDGEEIEGEEIGVEEEMAADTKDDLPRSDEEAQMEPKDDLAKTEEKGDAGMNEEDNGAADTEDDENLVDTSETEEEEKQRAERILQEHKNVKLLPGECSYEDRLETIRNFCRNNKELYNPILMTKPINLQGFFVNKKEKTIYCGLPTTGINHWDSLVIQTIGRPLDLPHIPFTEPQEVLLEDKGIGLLSKYPVQEIQSMLKTYRRVLVVQNPMTRLVTSHQLRSKDQKWLDTKTVQGFFRHPLAKIPTVKANDFTFTKYIQFVLAEYFNEFDRHSKSFVDMCMPCAIQYDEVFKAETLPLNDTDLLTKELLSFDGNSEPVRNNVLLDAFRKVDDSLQVSLINIYENDFEMFGYQWDPSKREAECKQLDKSGKKCC